MKTEALILGKLLVKELGLEESVDTLSRWMAHHIAQKMSNIESATGNEKQVAEAECFETILKLWKHRAYYQAGNKPFENYEPIFRTLYGINPNSEKPYYFQQEYSNVDDSDAIEDPVKKQLLIASQIDKTARIWLKAVFRKAAECAMDKKTEEWIYAAAPFSNNNDESQLIIRILYEMSDENKVVDDKEEMTALINKRIDQLKYFREFNEVLISMYEEELTQYR